MKCRPHCSVCKLILDVAQCRGDDLHPGLAAIDRDVQGIALHIGSLSSEETFLTVEYGLRTIRTIRFVDEDNHEIVLRQGFEVAAGQFGRSLTDPSGPVHNVFGQLFLTNLLSYWLNRCERDHGKNCDIAGSGRCSETTIDLVLIDVIEQCLVVASSAEKYFTLSYVW